MLSVSLEKVGEEDLVDILFSRDDSRRAARLFLGWLRDRHGRCSKPEMSRFSHVLASSKVLSRTNFCRTILHRSMNLGLIVEQFEYDSKKHGCQGLQGSVPADSQEEAHFPESDIPDPRGS